MYLPNPLKAGAAEEAGVAPKLSAGVVPKPVAGFAPKRLVPAVEVTVVWGKPKPALVVAAPKAGLAAPNKPPVAC